MKIIPIHSNENKHLFCEETPTWEVQRGYDRLVTGYLKTNEELSLLGISQTVSLLDTGLLDMTDSIDPLVQLEAVVLKITKDGTQNIFVQEVAQDPLAVFTADKDGHYRQVKLNYKGVIRFHSDNFRSVDSVSLQLGGLVNLELGDLAVYAGNCEVPKRFADKVEIIGYSINAYRVNNNRKAA